MDAIVSRTGYTGEDGFEIYFPAHSASVWNGILEAGEPFGLLPAGLGARNTLRLEAKMLLYGNDMDGTTTLLEAGLGWIVKFEKRGLSAVMPCPNRTVGRETQTGRF